MLDKELSLKISLDEILTEDFDYERKVMENLFRFSNYIGVKHFKVIFLHKESSEEKINEFVKRNENVLFHINSKITSNDCTAWFVIENKKTGKQSGYTATKTGASQKVTISGKEFTFPTSPKIKACLVTEV